MFTTSQSCSIFISKYIKMTKTTKEQRLEILKLYQSGEKDSTELSEIYGVSKMAIIKLLIRNNIPRRKRGGERRLYKYSLNENFFSIENETSAYWAGFIAADGCVYLPKNEKHQHKLILEISRIDESHLEKFDIGSNIRYRQTRTPNALGMCCKSISSNIICNDLLKYNITPNKSLTLEFPENITIENARHFIRGYFDGDGCFTVDSTNYPRYSFLGTEKFLNIINSLLPVKSKIIKVKNGNIFYLNFNGVKNCKKIYDFLYSESNLYLDRKKDKAEEFFNPILNF